MAFKYKLKEIEVGDTKVTGGVKSVVTGKDPVTGAISWSIDYVPNLTKLVEDSMELADTAKGVYQKAKDDKKFLDIYEQAKQLRNVIRTHVRNNYPEDYRKAVREEEEIEEMSTTGGGAGSASFSAGTGMQYATPYAFKKKKKKLKKEGVGATLGPGPKATEDGVKDNYIVKAFKYTLVPKNKKGTYVQKKSGLEVNKLF
tara:strand:- start:30 stop:629 length:600 start_codon:yes stop_codon:yes gene_type:complete